MAPVQLPEENEFVLATIRKIMPYGAFCVLPEYGNAEAFLHVSEVASRWIKNIHEFISENQKVVVKVLRVDREKGQIDVSLRRVNEEEKRNKLESVKRGARSEKLLQLALAKAKSPMKVPELAAKLEEVHGEAYAALEAALDDDKALEQVQIPDILKKEIIDIVRKSIKKAKVSVSAELTLRCFGADGISHIRKALAIEEPEAAILYLGAPHYKLEVFAADYKEANKKLEKVIEKIRSGAGKDCTFEYKVEE
ncbi:Translation initiation factor 2 subunit alpha [uncultured archaeon]|nr:Translation initiation factor 2 subunit alpha [uncultured archaeon]